MTLKSLVFVAVAALSAGVAGVAAAEGIVPAAHGYGACSITNLQACAIGTKVRDHRSGTTVTYVVCYGYYKTHKLCPVKK